jgi:tetratricopeptide (TPR) repeat protein
MSRFLLALAFVFSLAAPAFAQASPMLATGSAADSLLVSGKQMLRAGENGDSLDAMYAAKATFERALADTALVAASTSSAESWGHYYIALADYRIADYLLAAGEENKGAASEHLKTAVEHLKEATRLDPQAAEAYSLLSSVYGWQIGLSPMKSMLLGPRVGQASRKAQQLAPDNPRVVLSAAISDFNTPEMFGGSKEKGLQGFQRAAELFAQEEPTDPIQPVWGHREAYAWLGIAYQNQGELESARAAFEKALEIDPDFGWVRDWLLPELEKANSSDAP